MSFIWRTIVVVVFVITMHSLRAKAQEPVTFLLRSGESLSLGLVRLRADVFTVRLNSIEFQMQSDHVAALNFKGGEIPD